MRCHREHLAGAEVLVFGPNVFDLDRLDPWRQRRLFRRRKELLDARAKSAETPSPGNRQAAVNRTILDRKSTRLNSSHGYLSYARFCLKKQTRTWPDAR